MNFTGVTLELATAAVALVVLAPFGYSIVVLAYKLFLGGDRQSRRPGPFRRAA